MRILLLILAAGLSWAQCTPDANGVCITGLGAIQNNLLGPLTPYGSNPWIFGDLAEKGTADNMAPIALAAAPALGTPLAGTFSWVQGNQFFTTTVDQRTPLAGVPWIVVAWTTVDGAGTGRFMCPISGVTSTTVSCADGDFQQPSQSGMTGYLLPPPNSYGCDFQCWTTEHPTAAWNYYDVAIALYRLYYRTLNAAYLTQARAYADIQWQWTLDHGYRLLLDPRAAAMISQFFRVTEGHAERLPGLYTWISSEVPRWANPSASPAIDNREAGYILWDIALGAKVDTDPARHAQYCSWLSTYVPTWNSVQAPDGSWPEEEYAINPSYVSAPKAFSAPFLYQGSPWREAINVKAMEAAYESLNDTSGQGCNNPTLAAATLTSIAKAVTWQNNYGRNTADRGIYYEVNSQSNDQDSVSPATGTVSIDLGSNVLTGAGTNFLSTLAARPFIGISAAGKVYKRNSCSDDTHCLVSANFGLYGEMSNISGSAYGIAPAASGVCHSLATWCFNGTGDRNLTRAVCGGIGWLYAKTLNATYKGWTDECLSAQLGGPTAGLTSAANEGASTLPCSGPACDGLVTDTWEAAPNCGTTVPVNTSPCLYGNRGPANTSVLGKNFGEAFGAPGIDNALAWRLPAPQSVLTVTTATATAITSTTASSGGIVTSNGGFPVTSEGVCYATTVNPTTPCTSDGTATPFTSALAGLTPGTLYHYRSFAANSMGTAYGPDLTFTTLTVPSVTTTTATGITTTTASSGGTVTSNGGTSITSEGVCYGTTLNPASPCTNNGTATPFTSALSGLASATLYHYRAFATNSVGTSYGSDLTFTTLSIPVPTVTTTTASSITGTSANSGGVVVSNGGSSILSEGVCYGPLANPTTPCTSNGTATPFTSPISGLSPGTLYHYSAFAANVSGTSYGSDLTFTTLNVPAITTVVATAITDTTASSGGVITNNGGASVTAQGVAYGTTANPTSPCTGSGTSPAFVTALSGLTQTTLYHYRACATNSIGTGYGADLTFTTLPTPIPPPPGGGSVLNNAVITGATVK